MSGIERSRFDALRLPVIGRALRWRYGRLLLQAPLLFAALLLMYDGFTGPALASENLATISVWVHYRGVVIVALLLAGNLFCMGCPFTLPRTLAKRLSIRGRRFPRALRNKWLAIGTLFALFYVYEWLDLWSSPALTAWLIAAYFVASFVLEALFSESAFCKYVCPLGTFNFVYSTAAPLQITPRSLDICQRCVGKECVNGSYSPTTVIRIDQIAGGESAQVAHGPKGTLGCGTLLFVPQMQSNLDCTLCLDCVRACPHDNVALAGRAPGRELLRDGAWSKRWDVAFMVITLTFTGITNAFGMVPPVYDLLNSLEQVLGSVGDAVPLLLLFVTANLLLPVSLTLLAAWLSRWLTRAQRKYSLREIVCAFAPAFVPLGFGIWFAHYAFHFLAGALSIIPAFQNFLLDHNITLFGAPRWALSGVQDVNIIGMIQLVALCGGFLGSMIVAQSVAQRLHGKQALAGLLPFALLFLAMMWVTLVVFALPMEMRAG